MHKDIIIRKLTTGLILIGFCFVLLLIYALLMGGDFFHFWILIVYGSPLYLLFAPIWSLLSDEVGKKVATFPTNQKIISLGNHILGGLLASLFILFTTSTNENIDLDGFAFLLFIGATFAFPYWILDCIFEENNKKKRSL